MTQTTAEASRLEQIGQTMQLAAEAVAASLPLPSPAQAGAPFNGPRAILFEPPACTVVLPITGEVVGELVLILDSETAALLVSAPDDDVCAVLSPALHAAAEILGSTGDDPRLAEQPLMDVPDVSVPLLLEGMPVAGLQLFRSEDRRTTETEPTIPLEVLLPISDIPASSNSSRPVAQHSADAGSKQGGLSRLDQLTHVQMEVTVEIGRTRMPVGDLLALTPGQIIELDRPAGAPVDLYVNGTLLAHGEIVVIDEDFGFRVTEIITAREG